MYLVYPEPPPPPPTPKFCLIIFSNFSWLLQSSQERLKTMVMQNLGGGGGVNKVIYGV